MCPGRINGMRRGGHLVGLPAGASGNYTVEQLHREIVRVGFLLGIDLEHPTTPIRCDQLAECSLIPRMSPMLDDLRS